MTDHLPECPASRPDTPHVVSIAAEACQFWGICDRLRACEQRSYALGIEVGKHDGWLAGHSAGVQAAHDAVPHEISCWGSDTEPCDCFHASVVAAIDALKGEQA